MKRILGSLFTLAAVLAGCAVKEDAQPVPVDVLVEFPSTQTAAVTDTVRTFVWEGQLDCSELIGIRRSGRDLPAALFETRKTPCDLYANTASLQLQRDKPYTFLVAAQIGEKDFLVGCSREQTFGEVVSAPVTLAYASTEFTLSTLEAQTPGSTTKCPSLSARCGGCNPR
jgi:hypothetical protein